MDLRDEVDRLAQYITDDHARESAYDVGMAVSELVDRVAELERQAESMRIDLLALSRRIEAMDGASGR